MPDLDSMPEDPTGSDPTSRRIELATPFYVAASFVIIVAGMRMAAPILVPFLVSLFIAIVCAPILTWLEHHKLPRWASMTLVILVAILAVVLVVALIGGSINQFSANAATYQTQLDALKLNALSWLEDHGVHINTQVNQKGFDPIRIFGFINAVVNSLGGVFGNIFLILLTVIFLLIEFPSLPKKLEAIPGNNDTRQRRMAKISHDIRSYLVIKIWMSLLTAGLVMILLAVFGVDYVLLWGLFAFLLNFVPNIGSVLAAVPAVLLALVQLGLWPAIYVSLGYVVINMVVGNVLEPRLMGRGLGLSTLVVFVSLVFWGWVLGPVGMVFSVPLTMVVKIYLECDERTRWMAVMLGNSP